MIFTALDQLPDGSETLGRGGCVVAGVPYWFDGSGNAWKFVGTWVALTGYSPGANGFVCGAMPRDDGKVALVVSDGAPANVTWLYDVGLDSWDDGSTLTAMPTPRRNAVCGVLGGLLYVIGGQTAGNSPFTTVERYSPNADTWETLAPLDIPRLQEGMAAAALGKLWCFGSDGASNLTGRVYSPTSDSWAGFNDDGLPFEQGVAFAFGESILIGEGFPGSIGDFRWFSPATGVYSDAFTALDADAAPVFSDIVVGGVETPSGLILSAEFTGGTARLDMGPMLHLASLDHKGSG